MLRNLSSLHYRNKRKRALVSGCSYCKEFADIFLDDLPAIPLEREIDFEINLVSGAKLIFKAPYRMVPTESRELLVQLQELLDKKFIRLSVLPWGAPMLFVKKKKDLTLRMFIDY